MNNLGMMHSLLKDKSLWKHKTWRENRAGIIAERLNWWSDRAQSHKWLSHLNTDRDDWKAFCIFESLQLWESLLQHYRVQVHTCIVSNHGTTSQLDARLFLRFYVKSILDCRRWHLSFNLASLRLQSWEPNRRTRIQYHPCRTQPQ